MHTLEVTLSCLTILHAFSFSLCYPPPFLCTYTLLSFPNSFLPSSISPSLTPLLSPLPFLTSYPTPHLLFFIPLFLLPHLFPHFPFLPYHFLSPLCAPSALFSFLFFSLSSSFPLLLPKITPEKRWDNEFSVGELLRLFCSSLEEQIKHRMCFYKTATLVR